MKKKHVVFIILLFFIGVFFIGPSLAATSSNDSSFDAKNSSLPVAVKQFPANVEKPADELGKKLPLWTTLPFVGILLSIAVFPIAAPLFWRHHYPKVAVFWALVFAVPFLYAYHSVALHNILEIFFLDYLPFIIMLWALFTIAGGVVIKGTLRGKPITNTVLLAIGTLLASWVGTTGASMIMIRPVLRANASRKYKSHVVCFFIFLVANIGGSLTPLGDPPLFLGFLHGVPFFWTLKLFPEMFFASVVLLTIFFLFDSHYFRKEPHKESSVKKVPLAVEGWHNFFFLFGVVGAILLSGFLKCEEIIFLGIRIAKQNILRDCLMIGMGVLSLVTTKKALREVNEFSWEAIKEVAYLFAGIFMTIIPALAILKAGSEGAFAFLINAAKDPAHYYWMCGGLSSFLDNAPTYLTFFNSALGKLQIPENLVRQILLYAGNDNLSQEFISFLKAISLGSVFMGANTYIGNAPNFMVKSIAEEAGVAMPSFFGYIFKYSFPMLIPLFIVMTFVFF